jgi:hypothetical protein
LREGGYEVMKHKVLFIVAVIFVAVSISFATPQIPNTLILEGKEYPIHDNIMNEYFSKFPERNPKKDDESCSALWRGYRSVFEVADGRVFLKDIFTNVCFGRPESALEKVVPDGSRLFANWYTAVVPSWYGENPEDPYSAESLNAWEKYSFFEIINGKLVDFRHFDNSQYREYKRRQFEVYKQSEEYKKELEKRLATGKLTKDDFDANIEMFLIFNFKTLKID